MVAYWQPRTLIWLSTIESPLSLCIIFFFYVVGNRTKFSSTFRCIITCSWKPKICDWAVCSVPLISLPLLCLTCSRVTTRTDPSYPPMRHGCRRAVGPDPSAPLMCTRQAPRWWWFPSSSCPSLAPLRATSSPQDRWDPVIVQPNNPRLCLCTTPLYFSARILKFKLPEELLIWKNLFVLCCFFFVFFLSIPHSFVVISMQVDSHPLKPSNS